MDIAAMSMRVSQSELGSRVSMAVLDKAMETDEILGDRLVEMMDAAAMERSVNPAVGSHFDTRI